MPRHTKTDDQLADEAATPSEPTTPEVEVVENGHLTSNLTPYGAARLVNQRLVTEGIKVIPPQMMYNYTTGQLRKGKKPLIGFTPETGVNREALATWLETYVAKKTAVAVVEDEAPAEVVEEVTTSEA